MSAADQPLVADAGRLFCIKVISEGVTFNYKHRCEDAFTAAQHGMELCGGIGGRVVVKPVIEMTEAEGTARFPEPLHPDAFVASWRGWQHAANDYRALVLQVQRQGSL